MIKKFFTYLKINESEQNGDIVKIEFSNKFLNLIEKYKNNKYAKLIYNLHIGVNKDLLLSNLSNYLDIEQDYNVSFLKSRYFGEITDVWVSEKRTKLKITKLLKEFYKSEYIEENIKNTDIEEFTNIINTLKSEMKIIELRGEELLRAFNFNKECDPNFGSTCANFYQQEFDFGRFSEPKKEHFDIYVKNPDNCGVVIALENGIIKGRRTFQQGPNLVDSGVFKKGIVATVYGNYYGVGGRNSKYDIAITEYIKNKYNAVSMDVGDCFIIELNTRFKFYCPFDSMYVSFEHNLLTNNAYKATNLYNKNLGFKSAYHAECPNKYL